jgi:hypothetical protein
MSNSPERRIDTCRVGNDNFIHCFITIYSFIRSDRSPCHLAHGATSRTVSNTKINCSNEAAEGLVFN